MELCAKWFDISIERVTSFLLSSYVLYVKFFNLASPHRQNLIELLLSLWESTWRIIKNTIYICMHACVCVFMSTHTRVLTQKIISLKSSTGSQTNVCVIWDAMFVDWKIMKSIQWLLFSTHHYRGIIPALQSGPGPFKIILKGHIHEGLAPKNPQSCSSDLSERAACISFRAK